MYVLFRLKEKNKIKFNPPISAGKGGEEGGKRWGPQATSFSQPPVLRSHVSSPYKLQSGCVLVPVTPHSSGDKTILN